MKPTIIAPTQAEHQHGIRISAKQDDSLRDQRQKNVTSGRRFRPLLSMNFTDEQACQSCQLPVNHAR
jgi:hypothetical protein